MKRGNITAKRIWAFLLICLLCFGALSENTLRVKAQGASSAIILSVEKFTLGKGWITEPDVVPLQEGDTVATLVTRYLDAKGYPVISRNSSYGWYLEGIQNGDVGGELKVPQFIKNLARGDGKNLTDSLTNKEAPDLKEFSYADADAGTETSGWIYSVNNVIPGVGMDKWTLNNNDVVRIQFTLYGTGLDVSGENPSIKIYDRADKSKLLTKLAYINQDPENWLVSESDEDAYSKALEIIQTLDISQKSVDNALSKLPDTAVVWPEAIVLSSTSLSLYDNDIPEVLTAKIYPEDTSFYQVSWSSSDSNIVSVDNRGRVTPHQPGQAVITATTQNGINDYCTVTVLQKPYTSIALDKTAISLEAGNTYQLQVSGQPSNATETLKVMWSSSDPSVAVVSDQGVVTALAKGSAIITATKKGSDITADCQVKVGDAKELAMAVQDLIEALPIAGDLTIEDSAKVAEAEDAYNSLGEVSKEYLENRAKLEQKLSRCITMIEKLRGKYENVDQAEALIANIPSLSSLNIEDKKSVEEASQAYEQLKNEEKILLDSSYRNKLEKAINRMAEMVAEVRETNELLAAIPSVVSMDDVEAIAKALESYDSLDEYQKAQLSEGMAQRLTDGIQRLPELLTNSVQAVDTSIPVSLDSEAVKEFIKAAMGYDELKDSLEISESLQDQIQMVKDWIGNGIHGRNGVRADSYWYIQTFAEKTNATKDAFTALKKKYQNVEKIEAAWMVHYEDIRSLTSYEQEKNVTLTLSLNTLTNMENPLVFYYEEGMPKQCGAEIDLETRTVTVKSSKSGMFLIVDVPIPLTGLDMTTTLRLTKGSTAALKPEKVPENATSKVNHVWNSSDESIVSVDGSGTITAKKAGTATITVSIEGQAKIKASSKVTVITTANTLSKSVKDVLGETKDYILSLDKNPTIGSEWFVLALARNGMDLNDKYFSTYYNHLANYLKEEKGVLSQNKYTEYSKTILVVTAIGKDARNVGGYNLLEPLADFTAVKNQGFNGPIWALTALKCHPDYTIPKVNGVSDQTTEKKLLNYILDRQLDDGGWALSGGTADTDITGMALQSLSSYYKKEGYEDVTKAINRALDRLGKMQKSTGGFVAIGAETSESNAQVLTALSLLGIDPQTDARFIKNGKWIVENLITYHIDGSGFMHVKPGSSNNGGAEAGEVDGMATEQGFYALVAYQRLLDGKTGLYDMADLTVKPGGEGDGQGTGLETTNAPGNSSTRIQGSGSTTSGISATGRTGTVKKTTTPNAEDESENLWNFEGDEYVAGAGDDDENTDSVEAGAGAESESEGQDKASIFTQENIPYFLCVICGAAVIGVCVYFKRKK